MRRCPSGPGRSAEELDRHVRVHHPPDAEVRIELVARRFDLDLTGTIHDRPLADAAKKRNEPNGEVRIMKEKPQVGVPLRAILRLPARCGLPLRGDLRQSASAASTSSA